MPNEDFAHACRGRDGSDCGFGANRQVNYTHKKTGKTYFKRLCCRVLPMPRRQAAGKSQPESAAATTSPEGGEFLRRRRQRRFSPSGRPRPGTGRRKLDRLSARARQPDARRCRMVRVFLLVCWLASEALPMLKIDTLARLISLFQFRDAANYVLNVGKNYVNHMAAKDMTMSMAAVLREWINVRARLSPVLGIVSVLCRRYLQGFIRGRKVVQLFKHPDGWCEGMFGVDAFAKNSRVTVSSTMTASINPASAARTELHSARSGV